MNVCSLELSKELYELSGWDDEIATHYDATDGLVGYGVPRTSIPGGVDIPAYGLGFILRKLTAPEYNYLNIELFVTNGEVQIECEDKRHRNAVNGNGLYAVYDADTPENALCQLAIELFKQGILTKEKS